MSDAQNSGTSGMPMLQPLGGGSPQQPGTGLQPIGNAGAAPPPPPYVPPARDPSHVVPGVPQYTAAEAGATYGYRKAVEPEPEVPAGKLIGSIVAGLVVGALCLAGWLWLTATLHRNFSLIAVGVGWVIGFTMAAVAGKENSTVTGSAIVLALGFSVAGVWSSFSGGRLFGILFAVLSVFFAVGAAAKAAGAGDDSDV